MAFSVTAIFINSLWGKPRHQSPAKIATEPTPGL